MGKQSSHQIIAKLLKNADVQIGGERVHDIQVHDERFYDRVLREGSLGLGEAYMEGWWDSPELDQFFYKILRARLAHEVRKPRWLLDYLKAWLYNPQSLRRAYEVGRRHYDIGNQLYERMLDPRMIYSCGYWQETDNLAAAQEAKLELICRKLELQPGMRILDIGCGWGGAAQYAAERHGVEVVGVTVSREQAEYARRVCKGLPVDIRLQDYRNLDERFDHIFSVGMFEHVGVKNHRTFFEVARRCLKPDGLLLLHTIGDNVSLPNGGGDRWFTRYIFPNSQLPSAQQITRAYENRFVLEDWHSFGANYDPTLLAWFQNFDRAWDDLKKDYDAHFYRMWKYYLLSSAGSFRARNIELWQIVLSPAGRVGGYQSIR